MIMDYISSLPAKIVDESTPVFDEVAEEHRETLFNSVMQVEMVIPGHFKELQNAG